MTDKQSKSHALKVLLVSTILTGSTGLAFAADAVIGTPEPQPVAPISTIDTSQWGGFYAGVYGGYSWFDANVAPLGESDDESVKFGGYTGYNVQFDNNVVTGLELNAGLANSQTQISGISVEQDWDASLRARLGYAFDKSLIYSFAGVAITEVEASSAFGSDSQTLTGLSFGAGLEQEVVNGVTARIEYGFSDYGDETFATGGGASNRIELDDSTINLGVGVKF